VGAKYEQQGSTSDEPVVLVFRHLEREWQLPLRTPPPRAWTPSTNNKVRPVNSSFAFEQRRGQLHALRPETLRESGSFRIGHLLSNENAKAQHKGLSVIVLYCLGGKDEASYYILPNHKAGIRITERISLALAESRQGQLKVHAFPGAIRGCQAVKAKGAEWRESVLPKVQSFKVCQGHRMLKMLVLKRC